MWDVRVSRPLLFLSLSAVLPWMIASTERASGQNALGRRIATVGETGITYGDISYRIAVEQAYGRDSLPGNAALVLLVNDALDREIARSLGLLPTGQDIRSFREHVDNTTRAPETLDAIKRVFGADTVDYLRLFIEPNVIAARLRTYQSRDSVVQAIPRDVIERAFALIASGLPFQRVADSLGLRFAFDTVGATAIPFLQETSQAESSAQSGNDPVAGIARSLAPGELYSGIVEDDYSYRVVALVRRDTAGSILASITAMKSSYDAWYRKQAAKVAISILDMVLARSVAEGYGTLWWVLELKTGGDR